jgi:hypothetical protein
VVAEGAAVLLLKVALGEEEVVDQEMQLVGEVEEER